MKSKIQLAHVAGCVIYFATLSAYAEDSQQPKDEDIVVGACMIQKFQERTPPIPQDKIEKCSEAAAEAIPGCLGISEDDYLNIVRFCVHQLENAQCVSGKMSIPLMNYANCGYEKDPSACFKKLGFTTDQIIQFSTDCEKK